jgi:hypothetical protein
VSHDDNPILSLATAAIVVCRKATKGDRPDSDALNDMARMIAMRAPVFACSSERCSDLRLLTPDEVFEGQFEGGGTQISYRDGRSTITHLCMRFEDLPRVIDQITYPSRPRLRNSRTSMDLPIIRLCPFCHSAPMIIELDTHLWAVACSNCNAIGPHPKAEQDGGTAIQLWNEEPPPKIKQR